MTGRAGGHAMRRKFPPIPIDEHIILGNRLKDAIEVVSKLMVKLPASSRPIRDAVRTLDAIEKLCNTLDSLLCEQVPLRNDPRNLAIFVYFGEERFGLRWYDPDELARDTFAVWMPISGPRAERGRCAKDIPLPENP